MKGLFQIIKVFVIIGFVIFFNSCSVNRSQQGEKKNIQIDLEVEGEITYEIGEMNISDRIELTLDLENLLQTPVVINDIKGFCGCTIPHYKKDPIFPGKSSEVRITFIPHQTGVFNKELKMYLSSQNEPINIVFNGEILER